MNILILISNLNYGGAEKQSVLDANMLSDQHNVYLGCFKKGPLLELLNENVNLIHIRKGNYLSASARLAKIIKRNKIEVIHASLFAAMITSALASLFVSRVGIFWHFHSHEYGLPVLNEQLYKWMCRLPAVRKILFVSDELKSFLTERFKFPLSKTGILYNTSIVNQSLKSRTGSDECTVGYIGRLVELKRIHLLIECSEYLRQKGIEKHKVIIVGDGKERETLEILSQNKKLDSVVEFTGFQSYTESYLDKFDIFALPSEEECLSMALIDAGIIGIPCVAFNVGGNNEIIDNNNTGFIVNTKEDFFERIYFLATNCKIREQIGKSASEYCSEKFGREKHLEKLNLLYKELILV